MGSVGRPRADAPPTPSRADLDRIWPYIPGRHREEIAREYGVTDVLKLASNENPLGPSPLAIEAVERQLGEVHYYPDSQARSLRSELAERHALDPSRIVIGNGSVECIDLVARAFLRPGDEAVVGFPSFPRFQIACQVVGVTPRVVPHAGWGHDLDGLRAAVSERTRVLFLDNPCNPTGRSVAPAELAALLDDLPAETLVVLDRAYHEFESPDTRFAEDVDRIADGANLIVLRTFSKAYGLAGLRIGYAMAREEHARALERVREAFNTNTLAQAAAIAALDDTEHLRRTVETTVAERVWLGARFDELGLEYVPSETNFLFTNLGPGAAEVNESLLARGIVIRPMSAPGIETWARISLSTRAGNERLLRALREALG